MNKFVKVYVQKYKNKYKVTIEMDLNSANKTKGYYKVFRIFVDTHRKLEEENKLLDKRSLQYNKVHILQLQVKDIEDVKDMFSRLYDLNWCEFIGMDVINNG